MVGKSEPTCDDPSCRYPTRYRTRYRHRNRNRTVTITAYFPVPLYRGLVGRWYRDRYRGTDRYRCRYRWRGVPVPVRSPALV